MINTIFNTFIYVANNIYLRSLMLTLGIGFIIKNESLLKINQILNVNNYIYIFYFLSIILIFFIIFKTDFIERILAAHKILPELIKEANVKNEKNLAKFLIKFQKRIKDFTKLILERNISNAILLMISIFLSMILNTTNPNDEYSIISNLDLILFLINIYILVIIFSIACFNYFFSFMYGLSRLVIYYKKKNNKLF